VDDKIPNYLFNGCVPIYEDAISIDTTATPLSIRTANAANRIWVVGIWLANSTACNLTLQTASKLFTWQLAANQGAPGQSNSSFYFVTKPGETLSVQSSATITDSVGKNLVLRLIEAPAPRPF